MSDLRGRVDLENFEEFEGGGWVPVEEPKVDLEGTVSAVILDAMDLPAAEIELAEKVRRSIACWRDWVASAGEFWM